MCCQDVGNIVCPIVYLFLPCNSDLLADWRVIEYKFLVTTLIRNEICDVSRFFPDSYISICYDVSIR